MVLEGRGSAAKKRDTLALQLSAQAVVVGCTGAGGCCLGAQLAAALVLPDFRGFDGGASLRVRRRVGGRVGVVLLEVVRTASLLWATAV